MHVLIIINSNYGNEKNYGYSLPPTKYGSGAGTEKKESNGEVLVNIIQKLTFSFSIKKTLRLRPEDSSPSAVFLLSAVNGTPLGKDYRLRTRLATIFGQTVQKPR